MEKAIIFQGGQNYGRKYWSTLLDLIKRGKAAPLSRRAHLVPYSLQKDQRSLLTYLCCVSGEIDPSFIITHRLPLEKGPEAYKMFDEKKVSCTCQPQFIKSNLSGDITIVKLSACTQKVAIRLLMLCRTAALRWY